MTPNWTPNWTCNHTTDYLLQPFPSFPVYTDADEKDCGEYREFMEREGISGILTTQPYKVAIKGMTLGGVCFTGVNWINTFTFDIAVKVNFRRQGIGTRLVELALEQFEELKEAGKAEKVMVHVVSIQMNLLLERKFNFSVDHTTINRRTGTTDYYMIR